MPLDRVPGDDNLFIGSAFAADQKGILDSHGITHVLSVLQWRSTDDTRRRLSIDVDDIEEEDILVHLPRCVRFINNGLNSTSQGAAVTASSAVTKAEKTGAVYVHCAMGKSRSATAVIAFLLWKYPRKFGDDAAAANPYSPDVAEDAVQAALSLLRKSRPIVEPNPGFMKQLVMWWKMECPADYDDAVEKHPVYQRWAYQKDVEESTRIGRAPGRLWFGDEELAGNAGLSDVQLRCKKCRRVLADSSFLVPHQPKKEASSGRSNAPCQHYFVEPLSWMRPVLEEGILEGRLVCPNSVCNASLGRYSWQGFKCSCHEWVCPAFSLQRSKVDRIHNMRQNETASATFGIRLPAKDTNSTTGNTRAENL